VLTACSALRKLRSQKRTYLGLGAAGIDIASRRRRIDTLLCCGTSASGCVRATVTDAFMRDIRCMVIRECVADRTTAVLEANLFDLHQKYAEVVSLSNVLAYVASLSAEPHSYRVQREGVA